MTVQAGNTILFFGSQILPADSNDTLEDYDIVSNSNITLVQRVVGGGAQLSSKPGSGEAEIKIGNRKISSSVRLSKEKCVLLDVRDDSIAKRVKMPCGHAVTPDGLAQYVDTEIKKQKTKIICPVQGCPAEWKISELVKRGLTAKERENLELGLAKNTINTKGFKECLRCSAIIQKDGDGTRIACPTCRLKGTDYEFCWTCQNEWRNKSSSRICGNPSCGTNVEIQKVLDTCPTKTLYGVSVPEVRACPSCKKYINHQDCCKHMVCPSQGCKTKFCYICLSVYKDRWPCGSYNYPCKAAPRQKVL